MKNGSIFLLVLFATIFSTSAQVFQVDTLQYKGDHDKYLNIVIMGDGYTASEQDTFKTDAGNLFQLIFSQVPWSNYLNYFNAFTISVVSNQSGAKHPNTAPDCTSANPLVPVADPDNYFQSTFDYFGIHRLVVPLNSFAIADVLATNFPNYDLAFILVNSPYYGGSGGSYATTTIDTSSTDIIAHELGHSFASLADEYYAGDFYAGERENMTQVTDTLTVRWKNWLNTNGIGIYQHCCGEFAELWYRPHNNCKMRYLGIPYCSVCNQAIIETIHSLVNPLVSYTPSASNINFSDQYLDFKLTEVMRPVSNTLKIQWKLDGSLLENNVDSIRIDQNSLATGAHSLVVTLTDTTDLLRVDNHSTMHISSVTWTLNKVSTGVKLSDAANKISYAVYPNPTAHILNIDFELEIKSRVSIQLVSPDGKIVQQVENKTLLAGNYNHTLSLEDLSAGTYYLLFKINNTVNSQKIVKL